HVKTDMKQAREMCMKHKGVQILYCHKHFPFIVATVENIKLFHNHPAFSRVEEDIRIRVHRAIPAVHDQPVSRVSWNIQAIQRRPFGPKARGRASG
ncbi:hypothetical protein, partial [Aneurinibacillus tyrosinisolvens]|uniref:hypothetical protein n=1 Tax=Aneurinibacillus tyrosinisolvens TaxID=1443435 RepID=UPI00063F8DED